MDYVSEYFALIKRYRTLVQVANDKANEQLKSIEDYAGSSYHERKAAEIEKERMNEIETLRKSIGKQLDDVLKGMQRNAKRVIPTDVPTADMLNTIQLLKLKKNRTWNEVREAALICQDNPQAFAVVAEMAAEDNIPLPATPKTYGSTETATAITELYSFANTMLKLDKVNCAPLWWQMAHTSMSGVKDETGGQAMDFYLIDRDVADAKELITRAAQMESGKQFEDFCKAVND